MSEQVNTPETDAKHVALGIEYSVMSASYYEMREHARAMESRALAAEAKAPKWQPMETAPRDGTRILLLMDAPGDGRVTAVFSSGRWWTASGYPEYPPIAWLHIPAEPHPRPTPPMKEGE